MIVTWKQVWKPWSVRDWSTIMAVNWNNWFVIKSVVVMTFRKLQMTKKFSENPEMGNYQSNHILRPVVIKELLVVNDTNISRNKQEINNKVTRPKFKAVCNDWRRLLNSGCFLQLFRQGRDFQWKMRLKKALYHKNKNCNSLRNFVIRSLWLSIQLALSSK